MEKRIYICKTQSLCRIAEINNTVNQLYVNKKISKLKKKKKAYQVQHATLRK